MIDTPTLVEDYLSTRALEPFQKARIKITLYKMVRLNRGLAYTRAAHMRYLHAQGFKVAMKHGEIRAYSPDGTIFYSQSDITRAACDFLQWLTSRGN